MLKQPKEAAFDHGYGVQKVLAPVKIINRSTPLN